ncbi:hypothetical protein PVAR5_8991 [Paecilomyces variotii No. 5]|uniref:Uncharacterized protein n=1 Tax=Byssochlamys spectabilis (strain No. 5 / NBRC 109023) TaxID=1356009 RepID=V5GDU0_BYSSN|nr:hypothetical protein PVAR5_8991 [Paecilomyces variotii No. 5]
MGKGQRARMAAKRESWKILAEGICKHETETKAKTAAPPASSPIQPLPSLQPIAAVIESIEDFSALPIRKTSLPEEEIKENQNETAVEHLAKADVSDEVVGKYYDDKVDATVDNVPEAVAMEDNEDAEAPATMSEEVIKDTTEGNTPELLIIERDDSDESTAALNDEKAKDLPAHTENIQQQAAPPATAGNAQTQPKKKQRKNNKRRVNHRDRAKRKEKRIADAAKAAAEAATAENEGVPEADAKYTAETDPVPFNWQYEQLDTLLGTSRSQETYDHSASSPYTSIYSGMDRLVPANAPFLPPGFATMGERAYFSYLSPYGGLGATVRLHNPDSPFSQVPGPNQYSPYSVLTSTAARRRSMLPPPGLGYGPPRARGTSRFFPREPVNENNNQHEGEAEAAEHAHSPELRATAAAFVPSDKDT